MNAGVAEQILYGYLQGRQSVAMSLAAHLIDPARLGFEDGYYEDVQGYSGGGLAAGAWVAKTHQLPVEYTRAVTYRSDADRDALLTLYATCTGGNPALCIDPEIARFDYHPEEITLYHDDQPFSTVTDRPAAVVQLLGPGGDWHHLVWTSFGKEAPDHYLVYALPGNGDFRERCSGIVRLTAM